MSKSLVVKKTPNKLAAKSLSTSSMLKLGTAINKTAASPTTFEVSENFHFIGPGTSFISSKRG